MYLPEFFFLNASQNVLGFFFFFYCELRQGRRSCCFIILKMFCLHLTFSNKVTAIYSNIVLSVLLLI